MEMVSVTCRECNENFLKRATDVRKAAKKGRDYFFCSQQHAINYSGRTRPKSGPDKKRPDRACGVCKKLFSPRNDKAKYCSTVCAGKSRRKQGGKRANYNAYMAEYMTKRYHRRREEWLGRLGGCCARCGTEEELQFDHVRSEEKSFDVAKALSGWSEARLGPEMEKCQILCRACHVEKTNEKADHGKGKVTHGMSWMYRKYGCRCGPCTAASKEHNREVQKRYLAKKRILPSEAQWRALRS